MPIRLLAIVIALVGVISSQALAGNRDPLPMPTRVEYPQGADNETVLKAFIGLPFRADGAVSDDGRWTLWADPTKTLSSPGFNCSGFVLTAVRHLTGQNIPLEEAAFDRDNDSGPDSALGRDWDYGLDLFLNLADLDNLMPTPQGPKSSVGPEGRPVGWGVDIHSHEFEEILSSLKTDQIYLVTISKPDRRFKVGLSYYHLALIHADIEGHLWIYQATARAGVHRLDLSTKEGLNAIRRYFPFIRGGGRRILLAPLRSQFLKPLPEAEKELEASLNEAPKDPPLEDLLKDLSGDILGQMLGEFLKDRTNGLSDNLTIVPDAQSSDQSHDDQEDLSDEQTDELASEQADNLADEQANEQTNDLANEKTDGLATEQTDNLADAQANDLDTDLAETDLKTESQADNLSDDQTDSLADNLDDGQAAGLADSQANSLSDEQADSLADSQPDSLADSQTDGLGDSLNDDQAGSLAGSLADNPEAQEPLTITYEENDNPWTAAGRLSPWYQVLDVEGDGLGGEVESEGFSKVASDWGEDQDYIFSGGFGPIDQLEALDQTEPENFSANSEPQIQPAPQAQAQAQTQTQTQTQAEQTVPLPPPAQTNQTLVIIDLDNPGQWPLAEEINPPYSAQETSAATTSRSPMASNLDSGQKVFTIKP